MRLLVRTASTSVVVVLVLVASASSALGATSWTAYLWGPAHQSHSQATAITPANAAGLVEAWHWTPPAAIGSQPFSMLNASPTVAGGKVFIGSNSGMFFALDTATGRQLWARDLGHVPTLSCPGSGIASTAAVAPDASRGGKLLVYVAGGDGYMYALDPATGATI